MARRVEEIMNRELFSLRPEDDVNDARGYLLALGVTGAAVVDARGTPVGTVSLGDLVREHGGPTVLDRAKQPAVGVLPTALVRDAARLMAERGLQRVPVVDPDERVIGMVSLIDVVRALVGVPVSHPDTFPHYDSETRLTWTDDTPLDLDHAAFAPDGPGVLVLRLGGPNLPESDVWVEASNNVRARVHDLLSLPQVNRSLTGLLQRFPSDLRFRAASDPDPEHRAMTAERIRARISDWTRPLEHTRP
jgi:predicted transcriptional regulator